MPRPLFLKTLKITLNKQATTYFCLSFLLSFMASAPAGSAYSGQLPQVDSPFSLPADFDPSAIESPDSESSPANRQHHENTDQSDSFLEEDKNQPEQSTEVEIPNTEETASEPPKPEEPAAKEIAEEYVAQAMEFYKKGNLAKAEALFARAAFNDPSNAKLWNNLGLIRRKQEKIEQAIAAYEKAIQVDPDYALAYKNLAVAYEKQKDYKKAARSYLKYAELAPSAEDSQTARKRAEWLAAKKP